MFCSTALDFEELSALLLTASRDCLTRYFSLIGDTCLQNERMTFLQDLNTPTFRFLGAFNKPLSSSNYGKALEQVRARKTQISHASQ